MRSLFTGRRLLLRVLFNVIYLLSKGGKGLGDSSQSMVKYFL